MPRIPPPWVIDELERARRQHSDYQQPLREIRRPPVPPFFDEPAPAPCSAVVVWSSAGARQDL